MESSKPLTKIVPKWLELRRTMVNCSWYARNVTHQMEKFKWHKTTKPWMRKMLKRMPARKRKALFVKAWNHQNIHHQEMKLSSRKYANRNGYTVRSHKKCE